jgi:23S rRNA pseudouridine2605 synthase
VPKRKAGEVSLERALSKLGAASRAVARRRILAGEVEVAGRSVTDPSFPVVPERARIRLGGIEVRRGARRTLAFHKPRGVVVTRRDPQGRETVFDLLGADGEGLVAVGRLDLATTGLLLLTGDSRLADALTDPRNAVPRVYLATVRGRWSESASDLLKAGVVDGGETLRAAEVLARKVSGRESHLTLTLVEGRNREVRRLLAAAGHEVTRLKRIAFGPVELAGLAPGRWRELGADEIEALRRAGKGGPAGRRRPLDSLREIP